MKKLVFLLALVTLFSCQRTLERPEVLQAGFFTPTSIPMESTFYDFKMKDLDGKEIDFSQYKGKKLLIVNVASKCGYTPQYAALQELNEKYGDKVQVLGFPANNFGGQEPGSNEEIKSFCSENYGVTFPVFEKISVKGFDKHPLYRWLSDEKMNGWNNQEPTWNFCKYLIDEKGELLKFFPSAVTPLDEEILTAIGA
ncbi:glutathione peroxidase [Algoriphagus halophilus]|uniref:Glutathione peroxidase n=1 Tax=Algoriphagus halophilus TaxID=226505 RepID=A0A1N6DMC2_9BACT|nr:glutathione peroxidase [Algoriphagus halophilus]SIN71823.1 glutathione peroxidase [Algoriphagus halophilus]